VSQEEQGKGAFFTRSVSLKWVLLTVGIMVILMAAIVLAVLLVDRSQDNARRAAAVAATSSTGVTSPYDLTELPADTDLDVVEDAAFISIFIPNESGRLTSYGISSVLPAAQALAEAIKHADKVDTESVTSTTEAGTVVSTITFVFATRDTLTFSLDMDRGLVARGGRTWRPDGNLRALVEAAVAGP
jgi:hypothetical protein